MSNLGRLTRVDLRHIWLNEASDFTPWLARPENLAVLAETVGLELELEAQEKNVGPFRADLLCQDLATGQWVLIENQLETTDHRHMGQLLTYAAGLHAVTIIWVAARFTEEHRAAIDWLNEITHDGFRFFGLEVELWRIGDSPAAPRFNIISKPNNWSRSVGKAARQIDEGEISDRRALQLRYWQAFADYLDEHRVGLRGRNPSPRNLMKFPIGRSGFFLCGKIIASSARIRAELYINHPVADVCFNLLQNQKEAIERDLGEPLIWEPLPDKDGCRLALEQVNPNILDEAQWPDQHAWLANALVRLDRVLRPRIAALHIENDVQPDRFNRGA